MKLTLDLGVEVSSESAKLPNHIVRRAKGQPSRVCFRKSAKPDLSAAFKAGKAAYGAAKKVHSGEATLAKLTVAQKAKPSDARKQKIATVRAAIKTNRAAIKTNMSAARKHLRKFGTTVSLPFTAEQLSDAKKFAKVAALKSELNVTGIKGTVAPTLIADDKWADAVNAKAGKATAKKSAEDKPVRATKKTITKNYDQVEKNMRKRKGAITGGASPAKMRAHKAQQRGESPEVVEALLKGKKRSDIKSPAVMKAEINGVKLSPKRIAELNANHAQRKKENAAEDRAILKNLNGVLGTKLKKSELKGAKVVSNKLGALKLTLRDGTVHSIKSTVAKKAGIDADKIDLILPE